MSEYQLPQSEMGTFDSLNGSRLAGDQFMIRLDMDELAQAVCNLTMGEHRLLSAIARLRLERDPNDAMGLGIKALLDSGVT